MNLSVVTKIYNKNSIKIAVSVLAVILFLFVIFFWLDFKFAQRLIISKQATYSIDGDKIPSISGVVGQRIISGYEKKTSNGQTIENYEFKNIKNPQKDLTKYMNYLRDKDGFANTTDYNLEGDSGNLELAGNSSTAGKVIVVVMKWDKNSYDLELKKIAGSITVKKSKN